MTCLHVTMMRRNASKPSSHAWPKLVATFLRRVGPARPCPRTSPRCLLNSLPPKPRHLDALRCKSCATSKRPPSTV